MKTKIFIGLAITAITIWLIPYGKDHTNPAIVSEPIWDSPRTKQLFANACADCHSHQTKYPWYSNIPPASWLLTRDVEEGREHFNVSTWGKQKHNEGKKAANEVREGEMPLWFYLLAHPEARLSEGEKQELISGLEKTFGKEEAKKEEN